MNADGVFGCLIRTSPGEMVFRVYADDESFTDYDICAGDVWVTITDKHVCLTEDRLDYSPSVLGKISIDRVKRES